jgi:hypothetical protein
MNWKAKIVEDFSQLDGAKLYIYRERENGMEVAPALGGITVFVPEGQVVEAPTMLLHRGMAEAILEALLNSGVKPQEQSRVEGVLQATTAHLEDMRRLVFKEGK